jgi:hypothetical protein
MIVNDDMHEVASFGVTEVTVTGLTNMKLRNVVKIDTIRRHLNRLAEEEGEGGGAWDDLSEGGLMTM